MGTRWSRKVLPVVAVLAVVGAACGGDDEPEDGATTQQTEGEETTEPTDDGGTGVVVNANNFAFNPTEVTVASGDTITARNVNPITPHTFTVDDTDIDVNLSGGTQEDVTVDLDPGEYPFRCEIHGQMTGTLTVT